MDTEGNQQGRRNPRTCNQLRRLGQSKRIRALEPKAAAREKDFVYASIDLLRGTIRNRDAHRYAQNERAIHFHLVPNLLVPAFNILLATLDEDALRRALSKH
jgi:hypothetical protein